VSSVLRNDLNVVASYGASAAANDGIVSASSEACAPANTDHAAFYNVLPFVNDSAASLRLAGVDVADSVVTDAADPASNVIPGDSLSSGVLHGSPSRIKDLNYQLFGTESSASVFSLSSDRPSVIDGISGLSPDDLRACVLDYELENSSFSRVVVRSAESSVVKEVRRDVFHPKRGFDDLSQNLLAAKMLKTASILANGSD
jgi:hypothetical protein